MHSCQSFQCNFVTYEGNWGRKILSHQGKNMGGGESSEFPVSYSQWCGGGGGIHQQNLPPLLLRVEVGWVDFEKTICPNEK